MRSLLAYWPTGEMRLVANKISALLQPDIERISCGAEHEESWGFIRAARQALTRRMAPIAPPKFAPMNYDLVIVGCSLCGGKLPPPVRSYLHQYGALFMNTAYFVTHDGPSPDRPLAQMLSVSSKCPIVTLAMSTHDICDELYESAVRHFIAEIKSTLGHERIDPVRTALTPKTAEQGRPLFAQQRPRIQRANREACNPSRRRRSF